LKKKAKTTDYAWAAGIIDGEGSVAMTRARPGQNRRRTLSFQVRISVRMTDKNAIQKLQRLFGGTFKLAHVRNPEKHRATYEWFAGDRRTVAVLQKTIPYMITKKPQARLILDYRRTCFRVRRAGRCSDAVVKRKITYFNKLTALNRRGVS
jgi:hypothetical protein